MNFLIPSQWVCLGTSIDQNQMIWPTYYSEASKNEKFNYYYLIAIYKLQCSELNRIWHWRRHSNVGASNIARVFAGNPYRELKLPTYH